jgi:hypothetical protein
MSALSVSPLSFRGSARPKQDGEANIIKLQRSRINRTILLSISLAVICLVPSIPGVVFAKLLTGLLAMLLVIECRPLSYWPKSSLYYTLAAASLLSFIIISYFTLMATAADQTVDRQTTNMVATLSIGLLAIVSARIVNGYKYVRTFFKVFIVACTIPCISACITILFVAVGIDGMTHVGEIFSANTSHQRWDLYLPFTVASGKVVWLGRAWPRLCGLSREPGIFQCYLIMCLAVIDLVDIRFKKVLKGLFCLALLLTFSTIGIPLCVAVYAYLALTSRKLPAMIRVLACLAIMSAIPPILSFGPLATDEKIEMLARRDRDNSRTVPVILSYQAFTERPWFGYGIFSTDALSIRSEGISLLAALHKFGIVGLILLLGTWTIGLKQFYTARTFAVIAPLLITAITAQPIFLSGLMFFMMGLDTKQLPSIRT